MEDATITSLRILSYLQFLACQRVAIWEHIGEDSNLNYEITVKKKNELIFYKASNLCNERYELLNNVLYLQASDVLLTHLSCT